MGEFDQRVIALAKEQHRVHQRNEELRAQSDALFAQYIQPLDDEIVANTASAEALETSLRADVLAYMQATGDLHVHPALTFRRTDKLVYDRQEVVESLIRESDTRFIRTKQELDVRGFEKAWKDGDLQWTNVELVHAPTLAIDKLGDLVIALEAGLIKDESS